MKNQKCFLVYLAEFTARFCTWSVISQLLMHLSFIHWKTEPQQIYIVGASISLLYLSAILGGLIRDWMFAGEQVIILGIGLIALGCWFLLSSINLFYPGLSLLLLGGGMVTPNTPLLLASLSSLDKNPDSKFTILYGVTNAGVISGSLLGGIINGYFPWKGILYLNELMIALWFVYSFFISWLSVLKTINKIKFFQFIALLFVVGVIASFYLKYQSVSESLLLIAAVIYVSFLIFIMIKHPATRKTLTFSTFLIMLAIVFFSAEFQVASTLIDYAHNFVILKIVNLNIPAGSLLALESIFVVIGAFVIARVKFFSRISNLQTKILIGLLLGALSFMVLYASTLVATHNSISLMWLLIAFVLLGLGDVYLMPPIMAYVAETAPTNYKGRLMAGMYFSLSLSGYLSGLIGSTLLKHFATSTTNLHFYSMSFGVMVFILGLTAGVVIITRRKINAPAPLNVLELVT